MANKKITELGALTTPAGADQFAIVDDTDATTKRVTVTALMTQAPQGDLEAANNLSDLNNAASARTNLGLGTAATSASTDFSPAFFSTEAETTTARELSDSDNGKVIVCSSSSNVTITLPNTLTAGFGCTVVQSGTGQVSIAAGAGATLSSYVGTSTKGRYAVLQIIPVGTNSYIVDGEGLFPPGDFDSNIYAVTLDGTNDYGATSHTFQSLFRSSYSISMWVKMVNGNNSNHLITTQSSGSNRLSIYNNSGDINSFMSSGNVTSSFVNTGAGLTLTDWFNLVVTYEQSGTDVINKMYFNASLRDTGTASNMSLSNYTSNTNVPLGGKLAGTSFSLAMACEMDEVSFFNYTLTASQVTNIFKGETDGGSGGTNGKPGNLTTFNPQHWWRMGDNDSASGGGNPSVVTDKGGAATTYDLSFPNGATTYDLSTTPDSIYVAP